MKNSCNGKILLLPIIVALVTTLSIQFIEGTLYSELIHLTIFEHLVIVVMTFLTVYLFTITLVVPIDIYISKKFKNKIILSILFNMIGLILVGCIDILIIKNIELKYLYLIFPLFSILSLFQINSKDA